MPKWARIALPVVFVAQALVMNLPAAAERAPAMPDLSQFPKTWDQWKLLSEDKIDPAVEGQLGADQFFSRNYMASGQPASGQNPALVNLLVAWFQSQRGGKTQPHSPKVCLPGAGWIPETTGEIQIPTAMGMIPANRYIVSSGQGQRAVVLYWYQTPRRVLADEWASKFWLIPDALRDHRTDVALVRIVVWTAQGQEEQATKSGIEFAQGSYPILRNLLPR